MEAGTYFKIGSTALAETLATTKMNYFTTINKQARQRGTTLIELSVVIAVLFLLVGVLFIGITAWKSGANTAACLVNLSSIQKAARGYANMNGLNAGDGETCSYVDERAASGRRRRFAPAGAAYTWTAVVPAQGAAVRVLQRCRSRPVGGKLSQLVILESPTACIVLKSIIMHLLSASWGRMSLCDPKGHGSIAWVSHKNVFGPVKAAEIEMPPDIEVHGSTRCSPLANKFIPNSSAAPSGRSSRGKLPGAEGLCFLGTSGLPPKWRLIRT